MPVVFRRLDRVLPGDGTVARTAPVLRRASRQVDAGPNAPLLLRLVRYPFRLAPGRAARARYLPEPEATAAVDRRAVLAGALADRERVRSTSPVRGRPRPFAVRPSLWSLLPADEDAR